VFHRPSDAARDVIPGDGRGQIFEDLVERGEIERDVMRLVREHGIESARREEAAFQHSRGHQREQGRRLGMIEGEQVHPGTTADLHRQTVFGSEFLKSPPGSHRARGSRRRTEILRSPENGSP
jgi:hypothetical protein